MHNVRCVFAWRRHVCKFCACMRTLGLLCCSAAAHMHTIIHQATKCVCKVGGCLRGGLVCSTVIHSYGFLFSSVSGLVNSLCSKQSAFISLQCTYIHMYKYNIRRISYLPFLLNESREILPHKNITKITRFALLLNSLALVSDFKPLRAPYS